MSLLSALKRIGRVAAAQAVGVGASIALSYVGGINVPPVIAPLIPIVVGPLINGAAKAVRDNLDPEHPVQVVAGMF